MGQLPCYRKHVRHEHNRCLNSLCDVYSIHRFDILIVVARIAIRVNLFRFRYWRLVMIENHIIDQGGEDEGYILQKNSYSTTRWLYIESRVMGKRGVKCSQGHYKQHPLLLLSCGWMKHTPWLRLQSCLPWIKNKSMKRANLKKLNRHPLELRIQTLIEQ